MEIKKGQGEYKNCARCKKRFRRKKSIWNIYLVYAFCERCSKSFNKWWEDTDPQNKPKKK